MSQPNQSQLDLCKEEILRWATEGKSNSQIVRDLKSLGIHSSERSVRRAKKRWSTDSDTAPESPSTSIREDEADLTSKVSSAVIKPEDLMRERGLDSEEWEVASMTINEWDGPTAEGKQSLKQLKLHLRKKIIVDLLIPARIDGPRFKYVKPKKKDQPRKVVLVADQQAPFEDPLLHKIFCQFLADHNPDEGILLGDTIDLPDISRHPNNPERDVSVQECVDAGSLLVRNYREANSEILWKKVAGNHDERIRRIQIDKVDKLYNLTRAVVPGEEREVPVLDVGFLLRLDELGVEFIRPDGDYEHTQINLSPHLAARHGWIATKNSGSSALKTLEHLGYSIIVAHTHRQSLVHKTTHDINGNLTTLAACETGCMCKVSGGLGYAVAPDWQQGFVTVDIWPDGTFKIDLATFVNNVLYYRDRRYQ